MKGGSCFRCSKQFNYFTLALYEKEDRPMDMFLRFLKQVISVFKTLTSIQEL